MAVGHWPARPSQPARATKYITADMSADVALTKLIADPGPVMTVSGHHRGSYEPLQRERALTTTATRHHSTSADRSRRTCRCAGAKNTIAVLQRHEQEITPRSTASLSRPESVT